MFRNNWNAMVKFSVFSPIFLFMTAKIPREIQHNAYEKLSLGEIDVPEYNRAQMEQYNTENFNFVIK